MCKEPYLKRNIEKRYQEEWRGTYIRIRGLLPGGTEHFNGGDRTESSKLKVKYEAVAT